MKRSRSVSEGHTSCKFPSQLPKKEVSRKLAEEPPNFSQTIYLRKMFATQVAPITPENICANACGERVTDNFMEILEIL